jgi:succinate dehydrogenase / fumarate reductase cytochrome b subunit
VTTTEKPTRRSGRRRPWIVEVYGTDIGKKYAMAISGIFLLIFIFFHMIGNLHAFEGAHELNEYGEALRDIGEPLAPRTLLLWLFLRLPLALALAVHVHAAYALTRSNQRARGSIRYAGDRPYLAANYASRTMRWTGVIILLYLAWHLADLTWGIEAVNPAWERGEVYANLVTSLERWPVTVLYVVAQGALALHVWHGAWSMFQSLGVNNPRFNRFRRSFATVFTLIVVTGYLAVPVGVQLGIIG